MISNENKENKWNINIQNIILPLVILTIFLSMSVWRYIATKKGFFLFDLPYIGTSIAIGLFLNNTLPKKYKFYGRIFAQLLVGTYMFIFLGFFYKVNMQLEGFFFYLFMGIYTGATLHYSIGKIFGPIIFSRGWCGFCCWTAMILDFLPWKQPKDGRIKNLGILRYAHLILSFGTIVILFFILKYTAKIGTIESLLWMAIGNSLYYLIAIILAIVLKDNRAFCKYICPIPPIQKILSRFSLFKVKINNDKCIDCKLCEKNCPMNIKLLDYAKQNKRIISTECILCSVCSNVCPKNAINISFGFDSGIKEYIKFKE